MGTGDRDTLARFAFVCIHGVGMQRQGDTQTAVARSFAAGVESLGGVYETLPDGVSEDGPVLRGQVALPDAAPFIAEFHDGWWDDRAAVPTTRSVLGWILRVMPFALWGTAALWTWDLDAIAAARSRRSPLPLPFTAFVGMLGLLCALPLVVLVLLAAGVLSPVSKTVASWTTTIITRFVGDAWSYRSDALDESVIEPLRAAAVRARADADAVVLVGHSLGGELARRVAIVEDVDACVFVGSGEAQLGFFRMLRRSRWAPVPLWAFLFAFPLVLSAMVGSGFGIIVEMVRAVVASVVHLTTRVAPADLGLDVDAVLGAALHDLVVTVVGGGVLFCIGLVLLRLVRRPEDIDQQPQCETFVVKSLVDPVSFGPTAPGAFVRWVPVAARRAWSEHVTYFAKPETGVVLVESVIGTAAAGGPPPLPRLSWRAEVAGIVAAVVLVGGTWAAGRWLTALVGL